MADKNEKKGKNIKDEKLAVKKINKSTTKKTSTNTKNVTTKKTETKKNTSKAKTEKSTSKKVATSKKEISKKTSAAKKKTSSHTKSTIKSTAKQMLAEYYDLPYRYNETTVKILAQTPTTLFVYWDISDIDRKSLLDIHGENMFYETKPILIVHNTTKNYSFEVEINDFANSWYIRTQEPDCNYIIELGRKPINNPNEYIYIRSSNNIMSPNNHILFEQANLGNVLFRNVKTNVLSSKDFGSLRFINDIDKLYGNVYDVYSRLYKDETLNELIMPSSGEFINK